MKPRVDFERAFALFFTTEKIDSARMITVFETRRKMNGLGRHTARGFMRTRPSRARARPDVIAITAHEWPSRQNPLYLLRS